VLKGINLLDADFGLVRKSDPYVKISGVGVKFKTKVVYNNLNPIWNETFNIVIDEHNLDPQLLVRF
jgi:Ca2+-dependent lipid-binding protein